MVRESELTLRQVAKERSIRLLCSSKMMRFAAIEQTQKALNVSIERLCETLGVTSRGYRVWKFRPINQRQRHDLVKFVHVREQFALSKSNCGRPRMTMELNDLDYEELDYSAGER